MQDKDKFHKRDGSLQTELETALAVIGGKWKSIILDQLTEGEKRFNELNKCIPEITKRSLTLSLRELEEDGMVRRTVTADGPRKVEYALTDIGNSVGELIDAFRNWGKNYQTTFLGDIDK